MDKGDDASDQYLRNLNKLSHKISKPNNNRRQQQQQDDHIPHAPPQQPPVYNINKNDFREVVQKLTGSPAHGVETQNSLQPPPPPKQNSRLHRIRPPPLAQISPQPLPMLTGTGFSQNLVSSPLPPFPSVHAAAESPISAYLRFFQSATMATAVIPPSPLAFGCQPFSPSGFGTLPVNSPLPSPSKSESC